MKIFILNLDLTVLTLLCSMAEKHVDKYFAYMCACVQESKRKKKKKKAKRVSQMLTISVFYGKCFGISLLVS